MVDRGWVTSDMGCAIFLEEGFALRVFSLRARGSPLRTGSRRKPKAKGIGQRFTLRTVEKTNRLFARVTIDPMAGRFTK